MARPVTAALLASFLLGLNVERADLSCARHAETVAATAEHSGMQHLPGNGDHSPPTEKKNCSTPAQADCCSAFVCCSVVMAFERPTSDATIALRDDDAVALDLIAPHSRIRAPEPPPPRD